MSDHDGQEPEPVPVETGGTHGPADRARMVSSRRLLHVMLLLVLLTPAVTWLLRPAPEADDAVSGQEVGEPAPDFTVELFDGAAFTLSTHLAESGTPVVLNFWASWCIPCRVEMPAIDAVADSRPDIAFVGIAVQDSETAAREFADEVGVGYPLGSDTGGTILEDYPILGLPATWFITSDGMIAEQWFGQLDETTLDDLIDRHS